MITTPNYGAMPPAGADLPNGLTGYLLPLATPRPADASNNGLGIYWTPQTAETCTAELAIAYTNVTPGQPSVAKIVGAVDASFALSAPSEPGTVCTRNVHCDEIPAGADVFVLFRVAGAEQPIQVCGSYARDPLRIGLVVEGVDPGPLTSLVGQFVTLTANPTRHPADLATGP